jgi:hypothetical protein
MRRTAIQILRAGALALALAGFGGAATAQQPSATQVQLARQVVLASGATRAFDGVIPSILQQAIAIFMQQNPDLQKQLVESAQTIKPELDKRSGEIADIMAGVYATRFTEADLKELLAFYNSPIGKKFIATLPSVLEESFRLGQQWAGKLSEEAIGKMRGEMRKRGHNI